MPTLTITQVMDGRPCWERLTGERGKAFAAFQHYRDQGPQRTMRATAAILIKELDPAFDMQEDDELVSQGKLPKARTKMSRVKKETTAIGTLHNWATKHAWQERAEFFDRHIDRERVQQIESDTRLMASRHLEFSTKLITLAQDKLKEFEAANLTPTEALKFGIEGVKIERLTRARQGELTGIEEPETLGDAKMTARDTLKTRIDAIREKKDQARQRAEEAVAEKAKNDAPIRAEGEPPLLKLEKSG